MRGRALRPPVRSARGGAEAFRGRWWFDLAAGLVVLAGTGCTAAPDASEAPGSAAPGSASPDASDVRGSAAPDASEAPGSASPPPPWAAAPLGSASVPAIYLTVWRAADNRDGCALIAPSTPVGESSAKPRAATFSGGWAVAYDVPDLRSAFGVAGTGASAAGDAYRDWPHRIDWADGSSAEYGPEGGTGPSHLAYLRIPAQECLYNVWSRIGLQHLEQLLHSLRYVDVDER